MQVWVLSGVFFIKLFENIYSVSLIGKTIDFGSINVGSNPTPSILYYVILLYLIGIHVRNTTDDISMEGRDQVKSLCPLRTGLSIWYNGFDNQ